MALNSIYRKINGIKIIGSSLSIALLMLTGACQSRQGEDAKTKFGFDDDLPDIVLPTLPQPSSLRNQFDRKFCKGVTPGKCFSLVLHIPLPVLVRDLGLATLALASESKTMSLRVHEACEAGWAEYKKTFLTNITYKLRSRLVNQVEKMRCVFIFDDQPFDSEKLPLAENEIGLSLWLTKFGVSGKSFEGKLGGLGLKINHTSVYMGFRNTAIYSGSLVSPQKKGWHPVENLGIAPIVATKNLDKDIAWNVDFQKAMEDVGAFASDPDENESITSNFAVQALSTFDKFKSASSPMEAGMVLVGIGYNALQTLCKDKPDSCSLKLLQKDKTGKLRGEFRPNTVPSSETTEIFRLAIARSIQGALDHILVQMPPQQLFDKFPFSSGPSATNP